MAENYKDSAPFVFRTTLNYTAIDRDVNKLWILVTNASLFNFSDARKLVQTPSWQSAELLD